MPKEPSSNFDPPNSNLDPPSEHITGAPALYLLNISHATASNTVRFIRKYIDTLAQQYEAQLMQLQQSSRSNQRGNTKASILTSKSIINKEKLPAQLAAFYALPNLLWHATQAVSKLSKVARKCMHDVEQSRHIIEELVTTVGSQHNAQAEAQHTIEKLLRSQSRIDSERQSHNAEKNSLQQQLINLRSKYETEQNVITKHVPSSQGSDLEKETIHVRELAKTHDTNRALQSVCEQQRKSIQELKDRLLHSESALTQCKTENHSAHKIIRHLEAIIAAYRKQIVQLLGLTSEDAAHYVTAPTRIGVDADITGEQMPSGSGKFTHSANVYIDQDNDQNPSPHRISNNSQLPVLVINSELPADMRGPQASENYPSYQSHQTISTDNSDVFSKRLQALATEHIDNKQSTYASQPESDSTEVDGETLKRLDKPPRPPSNSLVKMKSIQYDQRLPHRERVSNIDTLRATYPDRDSDEIAECDNDAAYISDGENDRIQYLDRQHELFDEEYDSDTSSGSDESFTERRTILDWTNEASEVELSPDTSPIYDYVENDEDIFAYEKDALLDEYSCDDTVQTSPLAKLDDPVSGLSNTFIETSNQNDLQPIDQPSDLVNAAEYERQDEDDEDHWTNVSPERSGLSISPSSEVSASSGFIPQTSTDRSETKGSGDTNTISRVPTATDRPSLIPRLVGGKFSSKNFRISPLKDQQHPC